jgi:hypothetical protein
MGTAVHVVGHVMRETFAKKRLSAWQRRWNAGAPACGPSVLPETASSNKKDAACAPRHPTSPFWMMN